MMKLLPLTVLLAATAVSNARLGETLAECEKRYGAAKNGEAGEKEFTKNGIAVNAHFGKDGKCDYIFFTAYELLSRRKFTAQERGDLLKANNLGNILYPKESADPSVIEYECAGEEVGAIMVGNQSRIVFWTKQGKAALDAKLAAQSKKGAETTSGF